MLAMKLGEVSASPGYVGIKTILLISNTTDEVHSFCETLKGNQVLGGLVLFYWQNLNRGKFHRGPICIRIYLKISLTNFRPAGMPEQKRGTDF